MGMSADELSVWIEQLKNGPSLSIKYQELARELKQMRSDFQDAWDPTAPDFRPDDYDAAAASFNAQVQVLTAGQMGPILDELDAIQYQINGATEAGNIYPLEWESMIQVATERLQRLQSGE
jgi:hypothetical protein